MFWTRTASGSPTCSSRPSARGGSAPKKTRENLERDDMFLFALLKAIKVIDEASAKISEGTRTRLFAIEWLAVRRTRDA